jgi:hypothetical protein
VRRAFLLGLGPAGATRAVLETLARPAWRRVGERNARPAFIYSGGLGSISRACLAGSRETANIHAKSEA